MVDQPERQRERDGSPALRVMQETDEYGLLRRSLPLERFRLVPEAAYETRITVSSGEALEIVLAIWREGEHLHRGGCLAVEAPPGYKACIRPG